MHTWNRRCLTRVAAVVAVSALALGVSLRSTHLPYWLSVVSIRATVMAHCPASSWDAKQVANGTGGSILVMSSHEVPDATGRWDVPVGITPYAPGHALLCAYTTDGAATTLARASRNVTVKQGPRRAR